MSRPALTIFATSKIVLRISKPPTRRSRRPSSKLNLPLLASIHQCLTLAGATAMTRTSRTKNTMKILQCKTPTAPRHSHPHYPPKPIWLGPQPIHPHNPSNILLRWTHHAPPTVGPTPPSPLSHLQLLGHRNHTPIPTTAITAVITGTRRRITTITPTTHPIHRAAVPTHHNHNHNHNSTTTPSSPSPPRRVPPCYPPTTTKNIINNNDTQTTKPPPHY